MKNEKNNQFHVKYHTMSKARSINKRLGTCKMGTGRKLKPVNYKLAETFEKVSTKYPIVTLGLFEKLNSTVSRKIHNNKDMTILTDDDVKHIARVIQDNKSSPKCIVLMNSDGKELIDRILKGIALSDKEKKNKIR